MAEEAFEKKYEDVLKSMETAIVEVYRTHAEMTDWSVEKVLDWLLREYQEAQLGRTGYPVRFTGSDLELYNGLKETCDSWLDKEKSGDEIIACLKRIKLSLKRWGKEGGRRGYLEFINRFIQKY